MTNLKNLKSKEISKTSKKIFQSEKDAIEDFKKVFKEKTGNEWKDRKNAEKKSDKWYAHEIKKFQKDSHVI